MKRYVAEGQDENKPAKPKRSSKRFAYHECFHQDAWGGMIGMTAEQVGVYWRIILLNYIRKAALSDADDVETAGACHIPTRTFRRIKSELIALGRIEHDEESRVYFDKRAIEELTRLGFFSEAQTERALKRWADAKKKPRVVVNNVGPLSEETGASFAITSQLLDNYSPVTQNENEEKQADSLCRAHANQYPIPIIDLPTSRTVPTRAAQPPTGGGSRTPDPYPPTSDPAARLAAQRKALADAFARDSGQTAKPKFRSKAADRTVRRA
jgi:hypothetical protein